MPVEVTNALLVAIMFVTLLAMGTGSILTSTAGSVAARTVSGSGLFLSWRLLLLLVHLNLFWHTLDVFKLEDWAFHDFLFIISGPIVLFLATNVLIEGCTVEDQHAKQATPPRFFGLLALSQLWAFSTDPFFGDGMTRTGMFNLVGTALLTILALRSNPKSERIGNVAVWFLVLATLVLRGLGVLT